MDGEEPEEEIDDETQVEEGMEMESEIIEEQSGGLQSRIENHFD